MTCPTILQFIIAPSAQKKMCKKTPQTERNMGDSVDVYYPKIHNAVSLISFEPSGQQIRKENGGASRRN